MIFKVFTAPKKAALEKQVNDFLKKNKQLHVHQISTTASHVSGLKLTFATNILYEFKR